MDSAGCRAALQPTMSVRFWAAAWMQPRLPIDHFFYYRSKDKSPFTTPLSVRVKNFSYLTSIYGAKAVVQADVHADKM